MKFVLKCKVCGEELPEGSNLLKHILKHDPIIYFDAKPVCEWVKQKPAPTQEAPIEESDEDSESE